MSRGIRLALIAFPRTLFVEPFGMQTTLLALATILTNLRGLALALLILRAVFIGLSLNFTFPKKGNVSLNYFAKNASEFVPPQTVYTHFCGKVIPWAAFLQLSKTL